MTEDDRQWEDEISAPEISIDTLARVQYQDADDSKLVGERFGKYLIVGELAAGGMAEIFLGVQPGLEGFVKVVVIKRVLPQFTSNPDFVRMFVDEARLAARLEHPNIVRTYEFGEVAGQYYTTMEYLPGEDLSKALAKLAFAKQAMPVHVAAGIVSQVCAGLHFAHQLTDTGGRPLNLVHRDVNPANIIVTYGGEVKVIDFGVAKTNKRETVNGTIKGKIAYMSPEHLLARGIDRRSDVFSAGVVLWELLAGRPLFMRDTEAATLYAIMNDPIRPPSKYRPDVPARLDDIVKRALARTPVDRFDSAEEMAEALDDFLADQPKYDARVLGRMIEDLFGTTRAEAKKSISQTRSLGRNISLVMKLRTDVRAELALGLDQLAAGSGSASSVVDRAEVVPRSLAGVWAGVILACIAGGIAYAVTRSDAGADMRPANVASQAGAALELSSTPTGAAISIAGDPTGLKTPATITGLTATEVTIGLEHPDFGTITERIDVSAGGTIARHVELGAAGRLVIAGLPRGSTVIVDGNEHDAGTAIEVAPGRHDVRIVVDGRTVTREQIETTTGDQRWKFANSRLVESP